MNIIKGLTKKCLGIFNYDLIRKGITEFAIGKIKYVVDPFSVGHTQHGEITARGAIRMIKERGLNNLSILDVGCGVGIIGLTIFSELNEVVKEASFADINIFNLNSLKRILKKNNHILENNRINFWLSDVLKNIPTDKKFDIIISNPPHFYTESFTKNSLSPKALGDYDADWGFHKDFYADCDKHLTETGEVWFLENGAAAQEDDFLPFIRLNPNLQYVKKISEPLEPTFFWMVTRKLTKTI